MSAPLERSAAAWVVYLLVALVVSMIAWAAWAPLDVRVAGRGRLVNPSQNMLVRTLEPGLLSAVRIRPGQVVRRGEVLATLDPTFTGAEQSQIAGRELSLRAQVERLRLQAGERSGAEALARQGDQRALLAERQAAHRARLRQFDESIERLRAALEANAADQRVTGERVRSLLELEQMLEKLTRDNFMSRSRVLETQEKRLEAERDLTTARGRQKELEKEIRVTEAERDSYASSVRQRVREELAQAVTDSQEAREQLAKAQRKSELVTVVAPHDAVVLEVRQTALGSVLNPGDVLAVLVPLDESLLVEADIDPADIGEIRVGDRVRLKVDAYPFQKYGTLEGRLSTLSADALSLEGGPAGATRTVFRARIEITRREFLHARRQPVLLPGMTLSAEVIVGERTVLAYFLYPLIRTVDESIRER
jgi:hemolysin D